MPCNKSTLQNGKRELFNIGTWLRKRYGKFLAPNYSPDVSKQSLTNRKGATLTPLHREKFLTDLEILYK